MTDLISNVRIFPMNGSGSMKAGGKTTIAGVLDVSFKIMDGKNGLWVGWPGRYSEKLGPDGSKRWFSDVFFLDDDVRTEVNAILLGEYQNSLSKASPSNTSGGVSEDNKKDSASKPGGKTSVARERPQTDGFDF